MRRSGSRTVAMVAIVLLAVATLVATGGTRASAVIGGPRVQPRAGANTEMVLSSTGPGQAVTGFIANANSTFNPRNGYPAQNPTAGFIAKDEGFAGVIHGTFTNNGPTINFYCIDILTDTNVGVGYEHGTWDESNVPNVGYVARLLGEYYPSVPTQPAGLTDNQRGAAVQAAVWFFTDRYVLNTADPLHDAVAAIANKVVADGPIVEPPPPTLAVSPVTDRGPAGGTVGPFVVNSGTVDATVKATGATMFADAAGTQPIADGAKVPNGSFIWLRSASPGTATLSVTAVATFPSGNVYLYDGNTPGKSSAQKLILSKQDTKVTTVSAQATFLAPGSLTVTKRIVGPAAGSQGQVSIHVDCGIAAGTLPDFVIPAGVRGTRSQDYTGLPAGALCTITETQDGHTAAVSVSVVGSGQQITVPDDGVAAATLTDTYTRVPGSVVVRKTLTGPGAGDQGAVTITVTCNDGVTRDPFVIAAGHGFGTVSKTYTGIPGGTTCTIHETTNGANQATTVAVTGDNQQVTVPSAGTITADPIVDTYGHAPGSLTVNKVITGPAAGEQGPIAITVTCDGVVQQPVFQIAAGATGSPSQTYTGIPTPATCSVVEDPDGHTDTVTVAKARSGSLVSVPPGGSPTTTLTDTFSRVPGNLVVNKTITGSAAGSQGEIRISVACDDGATRPDFVIAAGTAAGTESQTYSGIPNGTVCTVTEAGNGGTTAVSVTTVGSPQDATIPVNGSATATITDTYEFAPGQLMVTKTITGAGSGQQGPITIQVVCGGHVLQPVFEIAAGATGDHSQTYPDIPGNSVCTVVENESGENSSVTVGIEGGLQQVTVPAGGTATPRVTDTVALNPGSLSVRKVIGGEAAPLRGDIRIDVDCDDGVTRDPFVIAAPEGLRSGDEVKVYSDIPAGTTCTVTETADGSTRAATVTVTGSGQQLTVPAGGNAVANLIDTFDFAPGDLKVGKRITGPAAGRQGRIILRPVCDGAELPPFVIPAGHPAGLVTHTYTGVPAGVECTGTEDLNGSTQDVVGRITVNGPLPKRILPGVVTRTVVTDQFFPAAASITVHKTVTGQAGGTQGRIVISTTCGDTTLRPDLVIPAGAAAGRSSQTYRGITPGTSCTITETEDGQTDQVSVRTTGNGQHVEAPVLGTQHAYLTDAFSPAATAPQSQGPTPGGPTLPNTGAPAWATWLLPLGLLALLTGLTLVIVGVRRRST